PFVAVYHPSEEGETPLSADAVEYFGDSENFIGIKITSPNRTDYLFNRLEEGLDMTCRDMRFNGVYAAVGEAPDGYPEYLFMGEGQLLEKGAWRIHSKTPGAQVSLSRNGDAFALVSSSEIQLRIPLRDGKPPVVYATSEPDKRLPSARRGDVCTFTLPAGRYWIR
ncbi:MAG: hypothetical protein LBF85_09685, partial [Tannerella sp.]|nr:hypothetical protein [Tannerella sp.]